MSPQPKTTPDETRRLALIGQQALQALFPEYKLSTMTIVAHDKRCKGAIVTFLPFEENCAAIWHICHSCKQLWPTGVTTGNRDQLRARADRLMGNE